MSSTGRRAEQRLKTRTAILDATETIMREEGCSAVSSRRIAEKAGLKSQLVHYHFGTMDELFLAILRRYEENLLASLLDVMTSPEPLRKMWEISMATEDSALVAEFTTIAMRRKTFQRELARTADRTRALERATLAKAVGDKQSFALTLTPPVLSFILRSVSRAVCMERSVGINTGHEYVLEFIESTLKKVQAGAKPD